MALLTGAGAIVGGAIEVALALQAPASGSSAAIVFGTLGAIAGAAATLVDLGLLVAAWRDRRARWLLIAAAVLSAGSTVAAYEAFVAGWSF